MKGIGLHELFAANVVGIVTARDALCIQKTRSGIESVLRDFQTKDVEDLRFQYKLGEDARDWSVDGAKKDIEIRDGKVTPIAYRPFDDRYTFFTGRSNGFHCRARGNIMKHMITNATSPIGKNVGLVFSRSAPVASEYAMVFVSDKIIESSLLSSQTSTIASVAPLYTFFELDGTWMPNFDPAMLSQLTEHMRFRPEPIEVFDYIYGILYDPIYRKLFNEYLKRDYPRVPVINNEADKDNPSAFYVSENMFRAYVAAGGRLRKLHLMQEKVPASLMIEPNTSSDMEIGSVKYKDTVLHLNPSKQIKGISEDVWSYQIGGYQVLDKWLKSHKGKTLTIDSFNHIENVVGLLVETIRIQQDLKRLHQ